MHREKLRMKNSFFRKVLKNGLTVLFEKRETGIVSVAFAVRQGGINETKEEKGISHFIEHLLYKGTEKRTAAEISEAIEKNGGIMNGFTDEEITAYWCKMPSEHLDLALDVLSDMAKNPKFDPVEVEKERKVIFEEMKMYKDNPRFYVFEKIKELMYKGDFSIPLIGTESSMNSNTKEKIAEKFRQIYSPENIILCVVGDADFERLCSFAEENFSGNAKKPKIPRFSKKNAELIEKREGIDQANLVFSYHIPSAAEKNVYAAIVLNALMADGMSSRLWKEIREKRNLAYAVKGNANIGKNFGYNTIYIGCMPENAEKVKKIVIEEFAKVKDLGEKELEQVKNQLIGQNRISKEDSQGQMLELLCYEIYGRAEESYEYEKKIREVNLEDVKKLASFEKYSFFALIPETKPKNQ